MKNMEWYGDQVISSVRNAKRGGLEAASLIVEGSATLRAPVGKYGPGAKSGPAGTYRSGPMSGQRQVGGNLRSSITHRVVSDEEAHIGTNVDYAPYVEQGTSKMAAQPFLRPALDENEGRINRMIGEVIGKAAEAGGR